MRMSGREFNSYKIVTLVKLTTNTPCTTDKKNSSNDNCVIIHAGKKSTTKKIYAGKLENNQAKQIIAKKKQFNNIL